MPELCVYDLPLAKFPLAAPLLHQAWFDEAYIDMVLEGVQPGRIFVDSIASPSAVLLCHPYEFYVVGDASPANPLRQFIKDNPAEPDIFHMLYGYCPVGGVWEAALLEDRPGQLEVIARRCFTYRDTVPLIDWRSRLPPQVTIERMNEELATRVELLYPGRLIHYLGTIQAFLEQSYGFCLLVDDAIAALIDVVGISAKYANPGIITVDAYRQRGYATLLASAWIEETLAQGRIPTWDCDRRNEKSAALAAKVGFEENAPFSQLSPEHGKKLPLSNGLWSAAGTNDDGVTWIRAG